MKTVIFFAALLLLPLGAPELTAAQQQPKANRNEPTYRVTMVPRSILAINYQNRTKTDVGFQGSHLMPLAKGEAQVEGKNGRIAINAEFRNLNPAGKFGAEYLTYVLWAITPEGAANNLGEMLVQGGKSKLQVTTTLQTFGLLVTRSPTSRLKLPVTWLFWKTSSFPGPPELFSR